jgi:hypothetical protein
LPATIASGRSRPLREEREGIERSRWCGENRLEREKSDEHVGPADPKDRNLHARAPVHP